MKKIFLTLIVLTLITAVAFTFIACDKNENENDNDGKVAYSVTVNCDDVLLLDTLSVKLLDTKGNAVAEEYLDANHKATFSLTAGVYKVVLSGSLSAYEDVPETFLSPTSLNVTINLTKKGSENNNGNKVTYKVTVKSVTGELLPNINVQLCALASEGGMCYQMTTDENGVATFELAPSTYELHILENQWPAGSTFDNSAFMVYANEREITVQFVAVGA